MRNLYYDLCVIGEKARARGEYMKRGVDVVRDEVLKLEDVKASHTLGVLATVER
jgi:hypothetical protein